MINFICSFFVLISWLLFLSSLIELKICLFHVFVSFVSWVGLWAMGNSFQNIVQWILIQFVFSQNMAQCILTLLLILQRLLFFGEILIQFSGLFPSPDPFRLELEVFATQGTSSRKTERIAEYLLPKLWTRIIARKRCKKVLGWLTSIPAPWTWWYVRHGKTFLTPSRWKRWVTWAICSIHSVVSLCFSRRKGSPKGLLLSPTSWSSQTAARWSQRLHLSRCIRSPHSVSPLGWLSWKQGRWDAGLLL